MITILRVIISPVFYLLFTSGNALSIRIAFWLFLLGAFTDYLDGWFARHYEETTNWGVFFDPLADKILTTAAFLAFAHLGVVQWWMVIVIFVRDIGTTLLRIQADSRKSILATSKSAKWKTFFQLLFIIYILTLFFLKSSDVSLVSTVSLNNLIYSNFTFYIMLGLTLFTIWTAIEYVYQNKSLFKPFKNTSNADQQP